MFTQVGLENVWREAKAGIYFSSADVEIVCDTADERCLKIYMHFERRYSYFSSKRPSRQSNQSFALWVRVSRWEPQSLPLKLTHAIDEFAQAV